MSKHSRYGSEVLSPHTPVLSISPMFIGAATDQSEEAFDSLEALVNKMGVRRTYEHLIPVDFNACAAHTDYRLRTSWISVKSNWADTAAGVYDGAITSLVLSIPSDHKVMLTWQHEPENDGGVAADYIRGYKHFYSVVRNANPSKNVLVGPIFIGWTFDPRNKNSAAIISQYCDPLLGSEMDFAGIDPYNTYHFPPAGNPDIWDEAPLASYVQFVSWCIGKGTYPAIGETACAVDTTHGGGVQRKVDWIRSMISYCDLTRTMAFCYFDTNINHDLDPSMLLEAQQESIDVYSIATASHKRSY